MFGAVIRKSFPWPVMSDPFPRLVLLLGIEYAWNVFPSTNISSGILAGANAALLLAIWFGYPEGKTTPRLSAKL